ncbi:IclR family transcriptional regulator [Streptomyces litchfieldiae]|uniref:Helix-turn-helix domain-containing protein n=1 Tax=Streptomyces litchfieldiae TaxID=3075543 RepID=A0ABU2MK29_9ACTN|nr:helix-turn-helix domain-containing protein [Streptomyces sp. DSM 44938]MDT0341944.1 helix-turn-helix domain-containing protein [Streptomyces sp. DSM 44938]
MAELGPRAGSPAVHRAARVLSELAAHDEALSVSELSRRLGLPKSSLADLVGVLVHEGMLARDLDARVRLGGRIRLIARGLVGGSPLLEVFARACAEVRELEGRTLVLAVLLDLDAAYLAVRPGARPLPLTLRPGVRLPAWSTGTGRALLSALPHDAVERMHSGWVPESPSGHPFRLRELLDSTALARARGYASNAELGEMALAGTAAVVQGLRGCVAAVGSIVALDEPGRADGDTDAEAVRTLARRLAELIEA